MEQDHLPCTPPEDLDRARFERVWRRVMPDDRPDCPFVLRGEGETPATRLMPPEGEVLLPALSPAVEVGLAPMARVLTPPAADNDVPLLGAASAVYGALLQDFIADALTDARTYRIMARRTSGTVAKALTGLSADKGSHAKRLSAAYFLISGVRYWPEKLPTPPMTTFMGGMRSRFIAEQKGEAAYRAAAGEVRDAALRELFLELASAQGIHARVLRGILEGL